MHSHLAQQCAGFGPQRAEVLGAKGCEVVRADVVSEVPLCRCVFGFLGGCSCSSANEPLLWQWPAIAVRRRWQWSECVQQMGYVTWVVDGDVDEF